MWLGPVAAAELHGQAGDSEDDAEHDGSEQRDDLHHREQRPERTSHGSYPSSRERAGLLDGPAGNSRFVLESLDELR